MKRISASWLVEDDYAREFEKRLWQMQGATPINTSTENVPVVVKTEETTGAQDTECRIGQG